MSFYEPQGWQAPQRQASWEQPAPPSRSGTSSTSQRDETNAFASQYEEIDRVIDNLVKSGKFFGPGQRGGPGTAPSMVGGGRGYNDQNPRMHTSRPSMEFDPGRSGSAGHVQSFYTNQRGYQGRQTEAEQMAQAKRRMAAQRERELRNYHQEQQYNRSVLAEMSSNKSDRSMSPSTLSEEGRRELIARQHRALYGNEASGFQAFSDDGSNAAPPTSAGGPRGNSPRGIDPFGMSAPQGENSQSQGQESRNEKSNSPTSNAASHFQKAPTPPAEEGHARNISKSTTAPAGGMAPIGSRPSQAPSQGVNKRSTTPLYNFGSSNEQTAEGQQQQQKDNANIGAWGTGSGVWGSNKIGGTAVWG